MSELQDLLRRLPAVSDFLASREGAALCAEYGEGVAKFGFRHLLEGVRECLRRGRLREAPALPRLCQDLKAGLSRLAGCEGRRAINAAGILLHTGLGRAPLCDQALANLATAGRYSVLQASLETGKRSLREESAERMLQELTGCEAATVVNNNAAATMLILNTLAAGREVVVSRGQLIEIGGSYRMMDVMAMSGCVLREVGCTNRTHLRDYENAINERTGALIHVHTSNYRVRGFAGTPDIHELAVLGRKHGLPVIDDLGSGALVPLAEWGLPDEPLVIDSIRAGATAACFSGDKLICGPQAGVIVGERKTVELIRKNPFARMFRVCKLTLAALEATLLHFLNGSFREALPFYRLLGRSLEDVNRQAEAVAGDLSGVAGLEVSVVDTLVYIGSGSIPDQGVASRAVRLAPVSMKVEELARRLRVGMPAVFGRVSGEALLLDMRTVWEDEAVAIAGRIRSIMAAGRPDGDG